METVFWKRFTELCAERGTNPTAATKAAGLSTGNVTYWKNGRIPNQKIIATLAEHFGVSPSHFVEEKEKATAEKTAGATEDEIRYALFNGDVISDDGWQMVLDFVKMVKEREKKKTKEE